jgi:predicted secreted protein
VLVVTAGVGVLGAGAWSAPVVPALAGVIQNQPMHLLTHATGRSATTAASSSCWQSTNWSGYVVSTGGGPGCVPASGVSYTSVSGTWTVPTVTGSAGGGGGLLGGLVGTSIGNSTDSAIWTGIDGATDSNLIQAGTEQDVTNGVASYYAWWEILPAPETQISSITVQPGDSITVSIAKVSGTSWSITLTDNGSAQHPGTHTFTTTQTYTGSGASAEWIVEAPLVGGQQSTLANYGSTVFDHGAVNGQTVVLASGTGGEMVTQSGILGIGGTTTAISVPSTPDTGSPPGDGFACAYGSNQPAAPTS